MSTQAIVFILCVLLIGYAYVGYPLLAWLMARLAGDPIHPTETPSREVSIVIAAFNESANIGRRCRELLTYLDHLDRGSEIIIVSDGSTDDTDRVASAIGDPRIRVIRQSRNMGKAMALNVGVAAAVNPIIVFADVRQTWAPDAIDRMLENFADPDVGAVSGDLALRHGDGSLAGVGLYWKLEKWIRWNESRTNSSVGVTGAISAVRHELFEPLPPDTILDDLCWPSSVTMAGYRVIHEPRACAYDCLPDRRRDEIRRKIRTLSGNLQLLMMRPCLIVPWRNPVWFGFISHKLLRLVVPWAMIAALVCTAMSDQLWLCVMLVIQVGVYALGLAAILWKPLAAGRIANAVASLLILNIAALFAWWVFLSGNCGTSWKKVAYNPTEADAAAG